jgi:glutamate racemase
MKIGVFDSGIGGESVRRAVARALPDAEVVVRSDREHMPYGDKPPEQVIGFAEPILADLAARECNAIVIACNTVTTTLITQLCERINVSLVGIEPMVKPAAAATKTGVIAVCATPATLASERYVWLKQTYAKDVKVLQPDCSRWAYMIEHNQVDHNEIRQKIDDVCVQGADMIVLGCTHYHWIEGIVREAADGRAAVVQPEQEVIAQLKRMLAIL